MDARWSTGKLVERRPFAEDLSARRRVDLMSSNALFVHVPVDRVDIINGPGASKCLEIKAQLDDLRYDDFGNSPVYVEQAFTLHTAASERFFGRKIKLAAIFDVTDHDFEFTAVFCGEVISGVYDFHKKVGWFNLD